MDYLNSHYNESISIEGVAALVHLSTRQFQKRIGLMPRQYRTRFGRSAQ